jgi:hypothetical protein
VSTPVEFLTVGAGRILDTYDVSVEVATSFLRPLSR